MASILLINGPNLNLLGTREPDVYGSETLNDVLFRLQSKAQAHNSKIDHFQSNHEGEIIDKIHQSQGQYDYLVINPGAFTHTSIAIRDAILGVAIPFIEVHLSNTHKREAFRQESYLSDIAEGVIIGLGAYGYDLALDAILNK